jgi:hypothetical protein
MRRPVPSVLIGASAALLLAGCGLLPTVVPPASDPAGPQATDAPAGEAPAGWAEFPQCEGGPGEDWVWVDGFPSDEFETAVGAPDCGDTWLQDDGETFLNITDYEITVDQLDAFGAALEASGYQKLFDDFVPGTPSGEEYYGARDYYLDGDYEGDFTRLAIEIYPSHSDPEQWTAYIDYLSPLTRQL